MQASDRPVVSVCIPAHNDAAVIGDALHSALSQDFEQLEIIVLDNHSTDDTWRIVTGIAASNSRVRCIRHAGNIGMARNFSACISSARGEYVQILCADDSLKSACVASLAAALKAHPEAVLAACGRVFADKALRPERIFRARPRQETVAGAHLIRECFVRGNRIGEPSAVMFRRSAAGRGFNADYSQSVDLEMWFHLLGQGSAVLIPEALCSIRQHGDQVTQANMKSGRIVEDKRLLFRQYVDCVEPSLGMWQKLTWDARMASSVARCRECGGTVDAEEIAEVFYPKTFLQLLLPLVGAAWKLRGAFASHRL